MEWGKQAVVDSVRKYIVNYRKSGYSKWLLKKKKKTDVVQARRIWHDWGLSKGNAQGLSWRTNSWIWLDARVVWNPNGLEIFTGLTHKLMGPHRGNFVFFSCCFDVHFSHVILMMNYVNNLYKFQEECVGVAFVIW